MPWEWSHTAEAYWNAYLNVRDMTKAKLLEVLREWAYYNREEAGKHAHFRLPYNGRKLSQDALADEVWTRAENQALCDCGGFNAWVCPYGCHTVSFDRKEHGA